MSKQYDQNTIQHSFLRAIADKKFLQGHTTMALMAAASSESERMMVAAVSLIDVHDEEFLGGLNRREASFVMRCHSIVQGFLVHKCCL
jgi:hypothetical protein